MDEEDDCIFYGTPLPEIEEEHVLRKKAARDLEVRDERGRQRFHGAFTGGFSAGYYNTVGTKEGWAPSTFVSSRSKTGDRAQQNPEDFMDEEDLGEFGISSRKIHTSYKFKDSNVEIKKRKFIELDNIIPGEAPLKEIVKPVRDSIGIEILKKLGWRPGQGIGPRIKKQGTGEKIYGCSLPDSLLLEEDDPYALSYTFAPEDVNAVIYLPKDDYFGVGYSGLSKESVLSARIDKYNPTSTKTFLKKSKKKLTISGQAFGVGAFEDDDDDIYSKDDMSQYDFSEFDRESDQLSISSESRKVGKSSHTVLDGFCLSSKTPLVKKFFPPPELPPNFISMHASLRTRLPTHFGSKPQHKMTVGERSFLLGENKFQSFTLKTTSIPVKENKQGEQIKMSISNPSNKIPSFKPFPNDSAKQERYEEYLKLKSLGEIEKLVQPLSMTEWEKQQELEEFSRSAVLFKPLSSALSSKFESKSHLSVEHEVMEAIEKAKKEKSKKSSLCKKKLVGLQNRKVLEWHPSSLLCKRFNVPNPYPNSVPSGVPASTNLKSIFDHMAFANTLENNDENLPSSYVAPPPQEVHIIEKESHGISKENAPKSDNSSIVSKSEANSVESKRPPIDFFKDIFENTSSEEEVDMNEEKQSDSPSVTSLISTVVEKKDESTVIASSAIIQKEKIIPTKSGFGVFANLDLDALNNRTVTKAKNTQIIEKEQTTKGIDVNVNEKEKCLSEEKKDIDEMEQVDLYGPELPPNYSEISKKNNKSHKKKHKLKHKRKHSKHKSKKKKKKTSHKSSNDTSSDSDEDISPAIILEKLKKLQNKI